MTDPVLVEVLRGGRVESRHAGAVAVLDADGAVVLGIGDIDQLVFPRSTVKAIQALPLVESGAADAFGFGDRELALACSSHSGETEHTALAGAMLARAGLDGSALECGVHWPMREEATVALAGAGERPSALHNNCSGKHSGFLCACRHMGIEHRGYVGIGHDYQRMLAGIMTEVTGAAHDPANAGTDGCSIPTYAVPLRSLALGFARMAGGVLPQKRARAAKRLMQACMAEPFYVAGTGRRDMAPMQIGKGRIFAKDGAEGVTVAAIPELGLGIALKCDDGAGRAADVVVAAVLARLMRDDAGLAAELDRLARPVLTNWNGIEVGSLRAVMGLA